MKKSVIAIIVLLLTVPCLAKDKQDMDTFIDNLLKQMTVEEKIGQLNLTICSEFVSGQINDNTSAVEENLRRGALGGLFGFKDAKRIRELQKMAVENSRLHIPLIFGYDVVHGFDVTFPIPLALSTSWNPSLIEEMARISAREAAADGVCWTYSPMVDICHDARWGRIAEGSGEDPYLGSVIAQAYVRGYQGKDNDMTTNETVMACVKHYALYGASEAGRDYNTVDMSRQRAFNEYMAPYKAAADAGAGSFMASFNEFEGIPAHCNSYLLDEVLRKQWGFKGFVTTDYTGIMETTQHGIGNEQPATVRALKAGIDMDMMSEYYINYLKEALQKGDVSMADIDTACRRILEAKYKLGLFDDPYKYCDPKRSVAILGAAEHVEAARRIAQESQVLLKNDGNLLPLKKSSRIAVIGPMANNSWDMLGSWSGSSKKVQPVSLFEGMKAAMGKNARISWAEGSWLVDDKQLEWKLCNQFVGALGEGHKMEVHARSEADLLKEALNVAKDADVIVAALGENLNMNGEGASRSNPIIPEPQQRLLKALLETGKPVVLVVFTGRPLVLTWEAEHVPAILNSWFLGVQAGPAMADVLFGDVNPSGRLTTTFPRSVGQLPMSYNYKNTGRPSLPDTAHYIRFRSNYQDVVNAPLYPFGYGLSYTTFEYSDVRLSANTMTDKGCIQASVTVTNTGKRRGKETVQMYIHDEYSTSTRPVKELKGFLQIELNPGEQRTVTFEITAEQLKYYNHALEYVCEPGNFDVMIGPNSRDLREARFELTTDRTVCNPIDLDYAFYRRMGVDSLDAWRSGVREAADPVVEIYKGRYYLFPSKSKGYWSSDDMQHWKYIPCDVLPIDLYAPTAMNYKGELYWMVSDINHLYKTTNPEDGHSWQLVTDHLNPYPDKPELTVHDPDLFLDDDGRVYLYWGCSDEDDICGIELDPKNGFQSIGQPMTLIRHKEITYGWEQPGDKNDIAKPGYNEGASMFKYQGKYYLQYASPGTEYDSYGDGLYVAEHPLGPYTHANYSPVSVKPGGWMTGAGHGDTFYDKHGNLWHVASTVISQRMPFERRIGFFPMVMTPKGHFYAMTEWTDCPYLLPDRHVDFAKEQPWTGWMDLTINKTATASTTFGTHEAKCAADNTIKTWWSAATGHPGEWLTIDLGHACELSAVQPNFADQDFGYYSQTDGKSPYQYIIEYSLDGADWTMLFDKSMNQTLNPHELLIVPKAVNARYLRITNKNELTGKFSLFDLRAFGHATGKVPAVVKNFKTMRGKDQRRIRLTWPKAAGATGYVVHWGTESEELYSSCQTTEPELELGLFSTGQKYYFRIDSYNESGITKGQTTKST